MTEVETEGQISSFSLYWLSVNHLLCQGIVMFVGIYSVLYVTLINTNE